ncbi:MAG: cyclic nucleotide-binding domain-containing protein [Mariprofundaceae bacterium]
MSREKNSDDTEEAYAELINIYPDNPIYLRRYAELLIAAGKPATASETLQRLHALYIATGALSKAEALTRDFPQTGRITNLEAERKGDQRPFLKMIEGGLSTKLWLRMNKKELIEGEILFQSGDMGENLFLILEGEIAIVEKDNKGTPVFIESLKRGELAGVLCFLNSSPTRKGTAIANTPAVVIEISRKRLSSFLAEYPRLRKTLENSGEHIEMILRISSNPILQHSTLSARQFLAREAKIIHFGEGETVRMAGDKCDYIDVLAAGSTALVFSEPSGKMHQAGTLKTGAFIGDVSGSDEGALPTDVVTLSDVTLVRIARSAIANIAEAHPALHESLLKHSGDQLEMLIEKLRQLGLLS